MDAELFEERTFLKIFVPVWIERVGLRPDFQVSPDCGFAGIHQLQPDGMLTRLFIPGLDGPRTVEAVCVRRRINRPCSKALTGRHCKEGVRTPG